MADASASAAIAAWAVGDGVRHLPAEGVALIKRAFLDTIAVTLLGARMTAPRTVASVEFARFAGGDVSVFAMGRKTDSLAAAVINGTSSHAELFDDNSAPMIAHPSGPLVSALLALAQARRATGQAVVEAYAAGFEVGVKLGRMLNPGLYEQGWHATRVLGVIGATAACARLIGLDAGRATHALGIATSMASGIRQNFGTMTMPLHVGLTARDAVHAALLAEKGFGADPAALEGKYGFFRTFADYVPELVALGAPFELIASGIIFKPYPCGAPALAAVDAALALRGRLGDRSDSIVGVTCFVHPWNAMTLRAEMPRDPLQAKVNLRFCVAAALLHGRLTYREFSREMLDDPALQDLMRRISVEISDALPDSEEFPAELRIETADGAVHSHRSDVPPGGSTRPLSDDDVIAKLRDCARGVLSPPAVDRVVQLVGNLDTLPDIEALCETLEGDKSP